MARPKKYDIDPKTTKNVSRGTKLKKNNKESQISVARPKKYDIDIAELEKLASYGCTVRECADFFICPERVISDSYRDIHLKGRNTLKRRLRMAQIKSALGGNVVMQIWLGKNLLDQTDKNEMEMNVNATEIASIFSKMVSIAGAGSATSNDFTL